jgi:low affinity Fe/Cu permease
LAAQAKAIAQWSRKMKETFRKFAENTANAVGSYWAFLLAALTVIIWAVSGPLFGFSDTWQLVINTGTTVVTFLMVFLIQNTQNRAERVTSLKLDELLRAMEGARTQLVKLDDMSDEQLRRMQEEFSQLPEASATLLKDDLAHIEHELNQRKERKS